MDINSELLTSRKYCHLSAEMHSDREGPLRHPQTDRNHADAELSILRKNGRSCRMTSGEDIKELCKFTRSGVIFKTGSELLHRLLLQLALQTVHSHFPSNVMDHLLKLTFLGTILGYYQGFVRLGATYTSSSSIQLR